MGSPATIDSPADGELAATSATAAPSDPAVAPNDDGAAPSEPTAPGDSWDGQLTELGMAFRRVFRAFSRLRGRDTHLDAGELSHAQFQLLIELHDRGELPAGELAVAAQLTPATVTQMLDHLADQGHVERVRSQTDRRVVVSRLTPQGRRQIEAKRAAWQGRWEQALDGVQIEELRAATRVLERLGAMVEQVPTGDVCGARPQRP
jgi:MarR family transcriptional regulator, organic hydroperoxide resistance regulator